MPSIGEHIEHPSYDETGYIEIKPGESKIYIPHAGITVEGFDNNGITYFFIPSYARIRDLNYDRSELKMYSEDGELLCVPDFGTIQDVSVESSDGERIPYRAAFFQSDNLYTLEIEMKNADLADVTLDRYSDISVKLISPEGQMECKEDKALIKARGNSTFGELKKAYEIKLPHKEALMGMQKSDKWAMLANVKDNTKICNKMAYDTAAAIGMEYVTPSDWADVYIDGVYWGNYLLCHEPDIGEDDLNIYDLEKANRPYFNEERSYTGEGIRAYTYDEDPKDISGGYLFSVDPDNEKAKAGFYASDDLFFRIKSPNNASLEEVRYIRDIVDRADEAIMGLDRDIPEIDPESFAKRYLINEVFANHDAQISSYYMYKKPEDDRLYAGPCWDYDISFLTQFDPSYACSKSILECDEKHIGWDRKLLENEEYRGIVADMFIEYADVWNALLEHGIDDYYERIRPSLDMDFARWNEPDGAGGLYNGHYIYTENNVRYLKYSMYKRLCYLEELYGVKYGFTKPHTDNGGEHKVTLENKDGAVTEINIADGGYIEAVDDPLGWYNREQNKEPLYMDLPIYEDASYVRVADQEAE